MLTNKYLLDFSEENVPLLLLDMVYILHYTLQKLDLKLVRNKMFPSYYQFSFLKRKKKKILLYDESHVLFGLKKYSLIHL